MTGDDAIDDEKVQVVVRTGLREPKLPTGHLGLDAPESDSRTLIRQLLCSTLCLQILMLRTIGSLDEIVGDRVALRVYSNFQFLHAQGGMFCAHDYSSACRFARTHSAPTPPVNAKVLSPMSSPSPSSSRIIAAVA